MGFNELKELRNNDEKNIFVSTTKIGKNTTNISNYYISN